MLQTIMRSRNVYAAPFWANKTEMIFAQRVFNLIVDEAKEYFVEELGPEAVNPGRISLGNGSPADITQRYSNHLDSNGVVTIDRAAATKQVLDAIIYDSQQCWP